MNFSFELDDIVVFNPNSGRTPLNREMTLVREFVRGKIFHARVDENTLLRVRSSELLRVRRPSEEVEAEKTRQRIEDRKKQREYRLKTAEKNRKEFAHLMQFRIRLTALGLPDKRVKARYNASNSPIIIKAPKRRGLLG